MELKRINERISYIESTEDPLSSETFLIEGDRNLYIFDVGARPDVPDYLNGLNSDSGFNKEKIIIISHFHEDHFKNIDRINYKNLYVGNYIFKKYNMGTVVREEITIKDGVNIKILPIPSIHAKGSVCMQADEFLFLGDAAYVKNNGEKLNKSLLNEEVLALKKLDAVNVLLSHENGRIRKKKLIINMLEVFMEQNKED